MGLFSSPTPEPQAAPGPVTPPVTQERLKALLDSRNWNWWVDNDGDLGGMWDDNPFYFILTGNQNEILQIYGNLSESISINHLDAVRDFILKWHHDKLWPKCYHRITDTGVIRIFTENTIDWEHGATDQQIMQQIECALGTAGSFYSALRSELGI